MDHLGLKTAHFWGHSDGGCVLLHLLFDFPHRVRSATLSGTPHDRSAYPPVAAQLCAELPKTLARGEADAFGMRDRLLAEGMGAQKLQQLAAALDRAWSATPNVTVEMMRCIDRPVLVVEAGADPFIPLDAFERITQAIPGARALRLPEMTHDPRPTIAAVVAAAAELAAEVDAAALGKDAR
jgi:pimeloyl-ACP methyl ester carboxylesterase